VPDLTLYFVRHGESVANAFDRAGETRPEEWDKLSERGWEQARALGRRLEGLGLELIVASNMVRAQETAQEPGAESFNQLVARVKRVQERLAHEAEERRILAVSHYGFLHFFLGYTMFGDDFAPQHLLPIYQSGHANTGITIFERRTHRVMDGVDLPGWILTTWNDQAHL
jgi:broad specificity phosphatase PhoE